MKFWINGVETPVYVDDNLPCKWGKISAFAGCNDNSDELWVTLMEKGWAKMNGSYDRISGGSPK